MLASYDWRVRHAGLMAIAAMGKGTRKEVIQDKYHAQLFVVLTPTLEDPEPRVHSHAAPTLIYFCESVARDTLLLYLNPIVERLLKLLNPFGDAGNVMRYVQEQAITTLAIVANASE
ncbi:hypothetical protein DXG01_012656 [Tephrocybe rancida]|nr:hypothetical protein DXG01_012656 [Tephrocybe rancida]